MPAEADNENYGALKALCESRVQIRFTNSTIVRPSVIVDPLDPTGRFSYWVSRLRAPVAHIVLLDLSSWIQFVDARDLAKWLEVLASHRVPGTFNAARESLRFGDFITAIVGSDADPVLVQLTGEQLDPEEISPWVGFPLWLPKENPTMIGFFEIDATRARDAGLAARPLEDIVADAHNWLIAAGATGTRYGITRAD